jgi:hypothetical protein
MREDLFVRHLGVALLIAISLAWLPIAALASRAEAQPAPDPGIFAAK